jgi:hypothetical protein
MKPDFVASLAVFLAALGLHNVAYAQSPLGTAFTYQGQLEEGGIPADGVDYDFRFRLFDDPEAGAQVGSALFFNDETVENGLFTLELDFGAAVFNGNALWLEVGVKREFMEPFTVLSPRQPLNATPYALYALDGPFVSGFWDASGSDIHNTNTGKVGVGTSSPDTKLHVEGGSDVEPDQGGYLVLGPIDGGNLAFDNNEIMARSAGGTSRLYLNNGGGDVVVGGATGGNLGIGAVPEGLLHVTRPDDPDIPAILLDRGGGYTRRQIDIRSDDDLRIARTGIRDDLTISGTGLVGIGTTSPSAALEVYNPIDSPAGYVLELTTKTMDTPENYTSLRFDAAAIDSTATLFGTATLSLNSNEAGDITLAAGGGNVGIGTVSPEVRLQVENGDDVEPGSGGYLVLGPMPATNLALDDNEIMARNNGAPANLYLNNAGGDVIVGSSSGGNLGVGTSTPDARLDVAGNVIIRSESTGLALIELGEGLDYAEGFDVSDTGQIAPGTVLVIDANNPGKLVISDSPYDRKVAGIVAGAKGLGSGVRLGAGQFDFDVALAGRVYCNVDATHGAVQPGDLLTTSPTPGYAMKVADNEQAVGAILGKAMEPMALGKKGQILVLVTLQ